MKRLLIVPMVVILFLGFAAVAQAAGYKPTENVVPPSQPYYESMPHYGYGTATNLCKTCHATHQATGAWKLTRDASANTACDYCHVGAAPHTGKNAYGSANPLPTAAAMAHTIGVAKSGAGDMTAGKQAAVVGNLTCNACHTVHGSNVILFGGLRTDILNKDPGGDGGTVANDDKKGFCGDCHDMNMGGADTHSYSAADSTHAWTGTSNGCTTCHAEAGNSTNGLFPHTGVTYKMLGAGRIGNVTAEGVLDNKCLACHWNGVGDTGVGLSY